MDLPQDRLEPILTTEAAHAGALVRFSTEMISLVQNDDHVTTTVIDRLTDEKFEIRSAYVVGADGANSKVAESIGLPLIGTSNLGVVVSALFKADLTRFYLNRPGLLYWFFQPGGEGWTGGSTFRFVRPWREWLLHFGFHPDHGTPDLSPEGLKPRIQSLIGDPTVDVEVGDVSTWPVNNIYAEKISAGRIFCVGDAIHRHPPNDRTRFQCLGARRVQHRLETCLRPQRSRRAGTVGVLRSRTPTDCEADCGSGHNQLGPMGAAEQGVEA